MKRVAICLAGNIKKGHEKINDDYWSDAELHIISHTLKPSCVDFLHPAIRTIVSTIEEGSEWIRSFMVGKEATLTIKDLESIKDAMSYYRHTQ